MCAPTPSTGGGRSSKYFAWQWKILLYLSFQEGLGDFQSDSGGLTSALLLITLSRRGSDPTGFLVSGSLESTDSGEVATGSLCDPGWMWLVPDHPGEPVEEMDTEYLLPKPGASVMMANTPFPLLTLRAAGAEGHLDALLKAAHPGKAVLGCSPSPALIAHASAPLAPG